MALPLPSAPLQAKFPRFGRSIRQLKKLYFFLTSLAVEGMFIVRRSRSEAVRKLYRNFFAQNTKEARSRRLLSPDQRAQFDDKDYFEVVGCDSRRRYRIYNRMTHRDVTNVYEIDDAGRPKVAWCFLPTGRLVAADIMLAQKIALETNEHNALSVANGFPPRADIIRATPSRRGLIWH